jgi:hypothetical protein
MKVKTQLKAGLIFGNVTVGQTNGSEVNVTQGNTSNVTG